jgi:hypothetical protein
MHPLQVTKAPEQHFYPVDETKNNIKVVEYYYI